MGAARAEGHVGTLHAGGGTRYGSEVARGSVRTRERVITDMEAARANIGQELERFAENTLKYIQQEARITFEPLVLPDLDTKFQGRHAMVVVRGHDYLNDLAALTAYLHE